MKLKIINCNFSICKVRDLSQVNFSDEFYFIGKTDEELSLVCDTNSTILAENKIGIFAISTYNTDYILIKKKDFDKAIKVLKGNEYEVIYADKSL